MAYSLVFLLYSFRFLKKRSVALYLTVLIFLSSFFGLLIGNVARLGNFLDLFNVVFSIFILLILCESFKNYRFHAISDPVSYRLLNFFVFLISPILIVSFFINILIIYNSLSYILISGSDITSFKNEGEAATLIRQWVNPKLVSFANFASPLGVLALALHFYYLIRGSLVQSVFFLIISLNVPLAGLHGLSRAAMVQFVLMYGFFYLYSYPAINSKIKININFVLSIVMAFLISAFYYITYTRFSESSYYDQASESFIDNRALYSIFDYFSQWNANGIDVMENFSLEKLWYGKSSMTLVDEIVKRLGVDGTSYSDLRYQTLQDNASSFNGVVATLLYDFSYVGTFIFALGFFFLSRSLSPRNGQVSFHNFICFGALITVPALFFTNNYLSNINFSVSVVYTFFAWFFFRFRIDPRHRIAA